MFDSPVPLIIGIDKKFEYVKNKGLVESYPNLIFIDLDNL